MKYLLDTNTCIYFLNEGPAELVGRMTDAGAGALAVSTVTLAELLFGAARSQRADANRRRVRLLSEEIRTLAFDTACADRFGRLKAATYNEGRPLADLDLAIAASAQAHGLVLVTHDEGLLGSPQVLTEDWVAAP